MSNIVQQWKVDSQSSEASYIVSELVDGTWQCGCIGWTRHFPRRDCKHILWVKSHGARPIDPMVMAIDKATRKAERSAAS